LLRPELVEAAVGNVFGGQLLLPSRFVSREIPRVGAQHAAVELYDPRGDTVEEGAIVGDHDRRRNLQQQLLQPLDGADIEVIRRLIEQQQVRLSGERKGERRTLALAARARRRRHPGLELEAMQELRQASLEAPALALIVLQGNARKCRGGGRCALQQTFAQRVRCGKLRLLLDESDVKSLPYLSLAVIQHGEPGDDPQESRLARAVATDQSETLAGLQCEPRAIEEWTVAERQPGVEQREQRHGIGGRVPARDQRSWLSLLPRRL